MLVLSCLFLSVGLTIAQSTISGTVIDDTGEMVIGATVVAKGTTVGTITDIDGKFIINMPSGRNILVFSLVGMKTKEVQASPNMKVIMENDSELLDEIVVVGYGTVLKKDVTSSISQVKGSDLDNLVTTGFDQQLAGRAAGVQVGSASSVLGAAPVIRIRGVNSISSGTDPLVIVDGVPMQDGNQGMLYAKNNALSDINPADIESYEILKDGAATAIYGSRASNGVILITTKRGKKGKLTLNYDGNVAWAKASKLPDLLNSSQFNEIVDESYANWGMSSTVRNENDDLRAVETDWLDAVYRTAFQQSHTISGTGGTEKSSYYFSVNYTDQEGISLGNSLERFSARANIDHQFTKWGKFGISLNGSRTQVYGLVEGTNSLADALSAAVKMLPNVPIYDSNNTTGYNINRSALGSWANLESITNDLPNIVWLLNNNTNKSVSNRALANSYLEIEPIKGLTFKSQIGVDLQIIEDYMKWSPVSGDGYSYNGVLEQVLTPQYTWNWQNIISYNKSFNAHHIDLTAVQEYTKYHYYYIDGSGINFSDPSFMENLLWGTYSTPDSGGDTEGYGLASYLFRANYNYNSKYYFGFSIRQDNLSKLAPGNRKGTFPGFSAAWRVSAEDFWNSIGLDSYVNDFKLRASWAQVGNINIKGYYPYMGAWTGGKYGGQTGLVFDNAENSRLKWESQNITDVGFDAAFLNNRFNFSFAWWSKVNKDIVLDVPMDPTYGLPYDKITQNIGEINNNGLEFTVSGFIIDNPDFKWNASLNFSTQNNKVKKLVNGDDIVGQYTIIRENESAHSIYGYKYAGVNKVNGYPMYYKADGSIVQFKLFPESDDDFFYTYAEYDPANPGDVSRETYLGESDKVILGSALPKWFGGFNNTFVYKDFDLNLFFRFSGGNKVMNVTRQMLVNMDFQNKGTEILGRWRSPENPGDGKTPIIGIGDGAAINLEEETNSRFVEKGDFLKLSNLALGYTLPKKYLSGLGVTKLRVYAQVQNVFTITKYKGLDPELYTRLNDDDFKDSYGVDYYSKPQQRIFSFGVNIGF